MKKPFVSVIVVNYNGGDVFGECLKSLSKLKYSLWELIVVDNGSTDGNLELIKKIPAVVKRTTVVRNKGNVGFAGANNQGLEIAKGELILLLNNDTKVGPDLLTGLVGRLQVDKGSSIGVIQPKIKIMANPKLLDSAGSYLTGTGFLQHWGFLAKDGKEFDQEKYIFSAKGACMLIRKEVINEIGLFDSDYGSYMEETDFCWRVWLAGYKILYYPKASIFHKVGFTSKRQNQTEVNYHSFKNRIATLFKNLDFINLFSILGLHLVIVIGLGMYYFLTLRFSQSLMVFQAIWWNLANSGKLLAKRKIVQTELRKKQDSQIFKYIVRPFNYRAMFSHFVRSEKMLGGEHSV